MTSIMAPVLVFSAFTAIARQDHETLNTSRMFTSLTLISLLGAPLVELFQAFPIFIAALACFQRVQIFLENESWQDYRLFFQQETMPSIGSWSPERSGTTELADIPVRAEHAIVIQNASFSYFLDKGAIIQNINLQVAHGDPLAVIGPVGSGKSLLLKALLGEVPKLAGSVSLFSNKVGFCDQTPWLANTIVRQNVVGNLDFEDSWYSAVIHACAIDEDIERLPGGDFYCVGTGGVNLSGGQKQRVVRLHYQIFSDTLF
jgi:ATP-binding cassette, subfamily C (CFTR/MRP), member 1